MFVQTVQFDWVRTQKNSGPKAAVFRRKYRRSLAEQPQHVLVGLRSERQRGGRQLLAGLQRKQVGAFLVGVGEREGGRTGLQRIDRRLGEFLADLHGRQTGAQRLRLRLQRGERCSQIGRGRSNVSGGAPAVGRSVDAERPSAGVGVVDGGHGDGRSAGLVQRDREAVAAEQVDAVEAVSYTHL